MKEKNFAISKCVRHKMAACQSLTARKFRQAAILTEDVEEPFSKLHYFSSKYTFRMMSQDRGYY